MPHRRVLVPVILISLGPAARQSRCRPSASPRIRVVLVIPGDHVADRRRLLARNSRAPLARTAAEAEILLVISRRRQEPGVQTPCRRQVHEQRPIDASADRPCPRRAAPQTPPVNERRGIGYLTLGVESRISIPPRAPPPPRSTERSPRFATNSPTAPAAPSSGTGIQTSRPALRSPAWFRRSGTAQRIPVHRNVEPRVQKFTLTAIEQRADGTCDSETGRPDCPSSRHAIAYVGAAVATQQSQRRRAHRPRPRPQRLPVPRHFRHRERQRKPTNAARRLRRHGGPAQQRGREQKPPLPALANRQIAVMPPTIIAARKFSTNSDPVTSCTTGVAANEAASSHAAAERPTCRAPCVSQPRRDRSIAKFRICAAYSPPTGKRWRTPSRAPWASPPTSTRPGWKSGSGWRRCSWAPPGASPGRPR